MGGHSQYQLSLFPPVEGKITLASVTGLTRRAVVLVVRGVGLGSVAVRVDGVATSLVLQGASDAVGRSVDVVHEGGVRPEGVDTGVPVVRALHTVTSKVGVGRVVSDLIKIVGWTLQKRALCPEPKGRSQVSQSGVFGAQVHTWSEPVRSTAPPLLESESQALDTSESSMEAMPNWRGVPMPQFPMQEESFSRWTMSLNILVERRSHVASERAGRRASACATGVRLPHDCDAAAMPSYL